MGVCVWVIVRVKRSSCFLFSNLIFLLKMIELQTQFSFSFSCLPSSCVELPFVKNKTIGQWRCVVFGCRKNCYVIPLCDLYWYVLVSSWVFSFLFSSFAMKFYIFLLCVCVQCGGEQSLFPSSWIQKSWDYFEATQKNYWLPPRVQYNVLNSHLEEPLKSILFPLNLNSCVEKSDC